jgi:hypothetical protein
MSFVMSMSCVREGRGKGQRRAAGREHTAMRLACTSGHPRPHSVLPPAACSLPASPKSARVSAT